MHSHARLQHPHAGISIFAIGLVDLRKSGPLRGPHMNISVGAIAFLATLIEVWQCLCRQYETLLFTESLRLAAVETKSGPKSGSAVWKCNRSESMRVPDRGF